MFDSISLLTFLYIILFDFRRPLIYVMSPIFISLFAYQSPATNSHIETRDQSSQIWPQSGSDWLGEPKRTESDVKIYPWDARL